MWNGKNKAVTFSFDDGDLQDFRLTELLNEYGLKGTFNLNSALFGIRDKITVYGKEVPHSKVNACDVKKLYAGHEVAVHTLAHPPLPTMDEEGIVWQVEEDRKQLEKLCGYPVIGMAYPCGGVNNDDRVAEIIGRRTKIEYARTITSTYSFALQKNLLRFNPTVYFLEDCLESVVQKFLSENAYEPRLLYIWGHSYELDSDKFTWEGFGQICKELSNRKEIFYGTNREVLL